MTDPAIVAASVVGFTIGLSVGYAAGWADRKIVLWVVGKVRRWWAARPKPGFIERCPTCGKPPSLHGEAEAERCYWGFAEIVVRSEIGP